MTLLVERIYRIETTAGGFELREEAVETPWVKDYDLFGSPVDLAKKYDVAAPVLLCSRLG